MRLCLFMILGILCSCSNGDQQSRGYIISQKQKEEPVAAEEDVLPSDEFEDTL